MKRDRIVVVGESIKNMTSITQTRKGVSVRDSQNVIYDGEFEIPTGSTFQILGIRNGYQWLHEHDVQSAHWGALKRLFLIVVDSSDSRVIGQRLEMTGVAARTVMQLLDATEQTTSYRWTQFKKERGILKAPVHYVVK